MLWREMSSMIATRGKPLPAGRHLLPELVATWNRGKGPIDGFSRIQKNVKAEHANLGPIAAIWLRLIMSLVYNAFQCYNLSKTVDYLLSDECTSFKDFQRKKARLPPFRHFCKVLAKNLTNLDYIDSESDDSDNSDTDTNANQNNDTTIKYNKREAYFARPELIAKRRNARLGHRECSMAQQSSCAWCC